MALVPAVSTKQLGGGRLYYKDGNDWKEIGKVKEFKYKYSTEETEGTSHDGCMEEIDDSRISSSSGEVSFVTENISEENVANAAAGTIEQVSYAIGNTLPDETVATKAVTIPTIKAGKLSMVEKHLKFIGANCTQGKRYVVEFYKVTLKSDSDIAPQVLKDFMQIPFTGKMLATDIADESELFTTYLIPAG